jgi:flagellar basal-body rod modification protein FlgD
MDDSQMTSQLAQISTLSGIENLNTTLGSISGQISTSQSLQASTLVGNGVMIDGTNIQVGSDSSTTPFGVNLSGASTNTTVTISDSTGKEVRTVQLGAQSAGVHSYSWDGTNDAGTAVAAGNYTIAATSTASGGSTITTTPLEYSEVYGVSTDSSGNSQLNLGLLGNVSLSQVVQII